MWVEYVLEGSIILMASPLVRMHLAPACVYKYDPSTAISQLGSEPHAVQVSYYTVQCDYFK